MEILSFYIILQALKRKPRMCYMHFYIAFVVYRKVNLKEKGAHLNQFVTIYTEASTYQ